jgi:NitT/TauT family transport system ATP-binding protein
VPDPRTPSQATTAEPQPAATASLLDVAGLGKSLTAADGSVLEVSRDITFSLHEGEFVSIVGPSGAGKTTLLRTVSGLASPDQGAVAPRGEPVRDVPDWLSIVFQEYNKTLFPWLSVRKNVLLSVRSLAKREAAARTAEALALVGLSDFAERYPWELSGGMQQRVALARAMASRPELLMMDEPFASVDALTRTNLEDMVQRLWREAGFAALLVTHDIGEAVYLSDRVLCLSARPSTVLAEIPIDLPRPRDRATRALPRFHELTDRVLSYIQPGPEAEERTAPVQPSVPDHQVVSRTS